MIRFFSIVFFCLPLLPLLVQSQNLPVYKDPSQSVDRRVADLLSRMTAEEKFRQLFMIPGDLTIGEEKLKEGIFGLCVGSHGLTTDAAGQMIHQTGGAHARLSAIKINDIQRFFLNESRLGIPVIPFDEALHGLVREGATAFPQSIALAATFDTSLMHRVAGAIAAETRSRGIRQVLSPVLNIARDVRWGRTEETYGEDPCLVSRMGHAFVTEFEQRGVITTPKHFAVNTGDGGRDSYPVHLNERILEEVYFPAFRTAVRQGGARSVMTAYNSLDGSPCSSNDWLLNRKLKNEWGFRGFVISDACAVGGANVLHMTAADYADAGKQAIRAGLDVIFQTDFSHSDLFREPFLNGDIPPVIIDSAVARVLRAKFESGLFESPFVDPGESERINGSPSHRELALQAARESVVLLKNEGNILPVGREIRKIAIIGPDAVEARMGGYSGPGNNRVSLLDGLRQLLPPEVTLSYTPGCGRSEARSEVIPEKCLSAGSGGKVIPGLIGEYYDNPFFSGKPVLSRRDGKIDFSWTLYGPSPDLDRDWYSVRWSGYLRPESSGSFRLGLAGSGGFSLMLNDTLLITPGTIGSWHRKQVAVNLEKDKDYRLEVRLPVSAGNGNLKLFWDAEVEDTITAAIRKASNMASTADMIILTAGIEEGEFRDRSSLMLPGRQEELIQSLAAKGKPLVVILFGGSAVRMDQWPDGVNAVLCAWYPGEAGGEALAEVLLGLYNPAGRLPITFPMTEGQLPLVYNHKPTGRGHDYADLTGAPMYPFGHGLSYTNFSYSDLVINDNDVRPGDTVRCSFLLRNSGTAQGDEVWQCYLRDDLASVARPVRELKEFGRITLKPGESKSIRFILTPEMMQMYDRGMYRVIETGRFRIMVGASSADIRLTGSFTVSDQPKK